MTRHLTRQEIEHFDEHGYVAPIRVMARSDAGKYRARVAEYVQGADDAGTLRTKAHLRCPALVELVRLPAILGPITDLLGARRALPFVECVSEGTGDTSARRLASGRRLLGA